MKRGIKRILTSLAVALVVTGVSVMAQGAPVVSKTVRLAAGQADTVSLPAAVADVLVANPGIADVGTLRSDRLYVVGRAVGDTNVLAFDAEGNQIANIIIHVRIDQQTLGNAVKEFFPKEQVDVRTVNDSIVLQGRISTPAVANQVRDLVGRFVGASGQSIVDLTTVRGEQQVMLKVRVLEARRSVLRELGINTEATLSGRGDSTFTFGTSGGGLTATPFGTGVLALGGWGDLGPLSIEINALERDGLVSTLAEPTLTAISGETAGFLAGGEFPVPASRDQDGNIVVEFRQFGVALNFVPTVLSNDKISLQLNSEVSERSDADGVTLNGLTIPGLSVRRAQTTVQMGSGGTMMIAGLLSSAAANTMNGVPGLQNLPILGNLFKSRSFQRGESELVFLVTPFIVEPYADQQAERVATATAAPSQIVQTSRGVSLQDPAPHRVGKIPASSVIWTSTPAPTPAGVAAPIPSIAPSVPLPVRRSESGYDANRIKKVDIATKAAPAPRRAPEPAQVSQAELAAAPAAPVKNVRAVPPAKAAVAKKPVVAPEPKLAAKPAPATINPPAAAPVGKVTAVPLPQPKPKAAAAPVPQKAASAPVQSKAAVPAAATPEKDSPLASTFMGNLKRVYGNRAPAAPGASFGYIVN